MKFWSWRPLDPEAVALREAAERAKFRGRLIGAADLCIRHTLAEEIRRVAEGMVDGLPDAPDRQAVIDHFAEGVKGLRVQVRAS